MNMSYILAIRKFQVISYLSPMQIVATVIPKPVKACVVKVIPVLPPLRSAHVVRPLPPLRGVRAVLPLLPLRGVAVNPTVIVVHL